MSNSGVSCKRVVLDLDGVVAQSGHELTFRYNRDVGTDLQANHYAQYTTQEFAKSVGASEGWVVEQISDPAFWLNAIPNADAWYWVNEWFGKGFDMIMVSRRGEELKDVTERWLDEWNIDYNNVVCVSGRSGYPHRFLEYDDLYVGANKLEVGRVILNGQAVLVKRDYHDEGLLDDLLMVGSLRELKLKKNV